MDQPPVSASDLQDPVTSALDSVISATQLERAIQRTPRMIRFNPLKRRLLAQRKAADFHALKGEMNGTTAGPPGSDDRNAMTSELSPIGNSPEALFTQQFGGTPKRFLKTIAKRKAIRRETGRLTKLSILLPLEDTSNNKYPYEETIDEHLGLSSSEPDRGAEIGITATKPEAPSDEESDDSQEAVMLERLIQTTSRASHSQTLNSPEATGISFSFGPSRLVRRADIDSGDESDGNNTDLEDLSYLKIVILDSADVDDLSKPTLNPGVSGSVEMRHGFQDEPQSSGRKKEEKNKKQSPRRLPVDELYLVSERVVRAKELSQEMDDAKVQPSAELPYDPISPDISDALKVKDAVEQKKRESKKLPIWSFSTFGKIDGNAYRFPTRQESSPQAEAKSPFEISLPYSDGFVGSEANPTGRFMLVPKQKREGVGIGGLTARVVQLELVHEKDYGLIGEETIRVRRKLPTENTKRASRTKTCSSATISAEIESRMNETPPAQQTNECNEEHPDHSDYPGYQDRQFHQDKQDSRSRPRYFPNNGNVVNVENSSLLQKLKALRKVTFDENLGVDECPRISMKDTKIIGEHPKARERSNSLNSEVGRDMAMISLKRSHQEGCEEVGSSTDGSEQGIIFLSSDDYETDESDDASDSDQESENSGNQSEESSEASIEENEIKGMDLDFDMKMAANDDMDSQSDTTSVSADKNREIFEQNDEEMDGELDREIDESKERVNSQICATRVSTEESPSKEGAQDAGKDNSEGRHHETIIGAISDRRTGDEGDASRISPSELSQYREGFMESVEDLVLHESPMTEAGGCAGHYDSELSQLSIAMSWKATQYTIDVSDTDSWRPREPRSSGLLNETGEDIVDGSSPVVAISRGRKSTGLHTRRRRTFSVRPLILTTNRPSPPPSSEIEEYQTVIPEIPETQFSTTRDESPELGETQVSYNSDQLGHPIHDEMLFEDDGDNLLHSSQCSFIPEEVPNDIYFCRASQLLKEHQTPKSRCKSTPARLRLDSFPNITTLTSAQPRIGSITNEAAEIRPLLRCSQQSYQPTPRSQTNLSHLTRQASFAFGTVPVSARKRTKTLPFVPPFKKSSLGI